MDLSISTAPTTWHPTRPQRSRTSLLADTMEKTGRAALLLRPFKRGLLRHFLYFKNEIRDFSQIGKGEGEKISSADCDPERYKDEYGERAHAMIEEKVKGHESKAAPKAAERGTKVVDHSRSEAKPRRDGKQTAGTGDSQREKAEGRLIIIPTVYNQLLFNVSGNPARVCFNFSHTLQEHRLECSVKSSDPSCVPAGLMFAHLSSGSAERLMIKTETVDTGSHGLLQALDTVEASRRNDIIRLREHPFLKLTAGLNWWPPAWTNEEKKTLKGELGTLVSAELRPDSPTCIFLRITYEGELFTGALSASDRALCRKLHALIEQHVGKTIKQIGDLEVGFP